MIGRFLGLGIGALALGVLAQQALAQSPQVKRGLYLVDIAGRNDCHTPGSFLGKRDVSRRLGGSDVGFSLPGMGVFVGPNLTPDKKTGLLWQRGAASIPCVCTHWSSRILWRPIMPYNDFANLTKEDALALVAL
jgi:hypothetical protein